MSRYSPARTVPIALVLIIIAVAIAVLISATRAIFFSGNNQTNSQLDVSREALVSTAVDHAVSMTVRGSIVADEDFRSYIITVTPSSRSFLAYTGYMNQKTDQQVQLGNNVPAYEQFVYALDKANLAKGTELIGDKNDTRGVCATGQLYQFDILVAGKAVKSLWTSTCKGSAGSLDGSVKQLSTLFDVQIPNSRSLISSVSL